MAKKTTTTEKYEDGELVERVIVVEEEVQEPFDWNKWLKEQTQIYPQPNIIPNYPPSQPYIGDLPGYPQNWC